MIDNDKNKTVCYIKGESSKLTPLLADMTICCNRKHEEMIKIMGNDLVLE